MVHSQACNTREACNPETRLMQSIEPHATVPGAAEEVGKIASMQLTWQGEFFIGVATDHSKEVTVF